MKKLVERFLVFFIGLPLILLLVVFLPQKNHLAANMVIILFSSLGALEFAALLGRKNLSINPPEAALLGALVPLAMTAVVSFNFDHWLIPAVLTLGAFWVLVSRVFSRTGEFDDFMGRLGAGFSVMIYPGLFVAWVIRMALWPRANMVILVFLLIVCVNDSAAWAAGMLFGKGNRGILPASPNKSVAGYIGGFVVSLLVGAGAVLLLPEVFNSPRMPSLPAGIILGLLSGLAGSLGDLGESVMKRSARIKDSGSLIPGRGGVLDTIDSIALAAPVYYGVYWFLFYP